MKHKIVEMSTSILLTNQASANTHTKRLDRQQVARPPKPSFTPTLLSHKDSPPIFVGMIVKLRLAKHHPTIE